LADEEGLDGRSEPPEDEESQGGNRRVRPLFRFMRKGRDEEEEEPEALEEEEVEDDRPRVRPVRVVKSVPNEGEEGPPDQYQGDPSQGQSAPFPEEQEAPFSEEVELAFQEEEQTPFVEEEGPAFQEEEEAPFAEEGPAIPEEEEAPFAEEGPAIPEEEEAPFAEEAPAFAVEEEPPFAQEVAPITEAEQAPFTDEGKVPEAYPEAGPPPEDTGMPGEGVPEVPYDVIETTEREEVIPDTVSPEEEAEMSDDLGLRQEETPVTFEQRLKPGVSGDQGSPATDSGIPAIPLGTDGEPAQEVKPHYHKYLKPDEELLSKKQARGRPTGFDRDLDADAGEIDFGIDLIDPSERKKKKPPKKPAAEPGRKQKGPAEGHDFDAEIGTVGLGVDIGVDYEKRRKRRL
jgi:hypothetical protein